MERLTLTADEAAKLRAAVVARIGDNLACPVCGLDTWHQRGTRNPDGSIPVVQYVCNGCGLAVTMLWVDGERIIPLKTTDPSWQHMTDDQVVERVDAMLAQPWGSGAIWWVVHALVYEGYDDWVSDGILDAATDEICDEGADAIRAFVRAYLAGETVVEDGAPERTRDERAKKAMGVLAEEWHNFTEEAEARG